MATLIESCPFCDGGHLQIHHHLMSHSVSCQSCKSTGPHRRQLEDALLEWNLTSRLLSRARMNEGSHPVHGRLHELEDAVRNLASALRYNSVEVPAAELELEH